MELSSKQIEYLNNATHRWNCKSGAVRSGKSYVDAVAVIPSRVIERAGKPGLNVILGVSKTTIERNVLEPMREIYGHRVGTINSENVCCMFGEKVHCLGAEKVSQVAKVQGASFKYCYGDEVAKWHRDVFRMVQSRLDKPYSCFDGSFNPENPTHWLKEFLDSSADIYLQKYRLFDNPFLPKDFVENLCKEYAGTIFYDRLVEGEWKRAEGAIYKLFADNPAAYTCRVVDAFTGEGKEFLRKKLNTIEVGVDFGGNQSGHAFVAKAYCGDYEDVIILKSQRIKAKDTDAPIDAIALSQMVIDFTTEVQKKYGRVDALYWDNAETVLGNSIRNEMGKVYPHVIVRPAIKKRIKDRIDTTVRLIGAHRFWITEDCETVKNALTDAVWNKKTDNDERLDDGSTDIDSLDAMEYTFERDIKYLIA